MNAHFQRKMASHTDCLILLKINRVEAVNEIEKFHKNPTKNVDFIA